MLENTNRLFKSLYNELTIDNVDRLSELYADEIVFIDPFHRVEGITSFEHYFKQMYQNLTAIRFDFYDTTYGPDLFHQDWVMTFSHPKINGALPVEVPGTSRVRISEQGKIVEHQDYFDAGQMLYKQLPVLGSVIGYINKRLSA